MPFLENVTRGRGVPARGWRAWPSTTTASAGSARSTSSAASSRRRSRPTSRRSGVDLPVYWGNRNWHPYLPTRCGRWTPTAYAGRRRSSPPPTAATPAAGSTSRTSSAARAEVEGAPEIDKLRIYCNHPGFVEPMIENTRARASAGCPPGSATSAHLVFTAHSVPAWPSRAADAALLAELDDVAGWSPKAAAAPGRPGLGPRLPEPQRAAEPPWLEPDVGDHLEKLAREGARAVVVVPIGFVSDHMEVRYDLDVEAAELAERLGLRMERAATAGTHPGSSRWSASCPRSDGPGAARPPWARRGPLPTRAPAPAAAPAVAPAGRTAGATRVTRHPAGGPCTTCSNSRSARPDVAGDMLVGKRPGRPARRAHQVQPDRRRHRDGPGGREP